LRIILNNREEWLEGSEVSISELLKIKNFTFRLLVIKVNGVLVKRGEYDHTIVREGDDVTVMHLVSGG
jgi:thiamine biosynthesis protein ThiS